MNAKNSNVFGPEKLKELLQKEIHPYQLGDELEKNLAEYLCNNENLEVDALASFIAGFYFREIFQKKSELLVPIPGNPERREVFRRKIEKKDVAAAIQETMVVAKKMVRILKSLFGNKEFLRPIEMLKLIDEHNNQNPDNIIQINGKIRRQIYLDYFEIDQEEMENKGSLNSSRHNITETAGILGLNEDNTFSKCITSELGAYLSEGKYKVIKFEGFIDVVDIENLADKSYKYPRPGYVRIQQTACAIERRDRTLEQLYNGGEIKITDNSSRQIAIQLPLAEYASGYIGGIIDLEYHQTIRRSDFTFFRDEIESSKSSKSAKPSDAAGLSHDENTQPLTRTAIKKNYPLTKPHAWDNIFRRQNTNGLSNAVMNKEGNKTIYSKTKLHDWLIKSGRYSQELLKDK